ncbi:MAG: TonB-dependent receptor [Bacteroidia bacterium]|nr:TonB-dependent receptor [Bacteroidia bacterium]
MRFLFFACVLLGTASEIYAQKYTISGYIRDAKTGEDLVGANILIKEIVYGAITNHYGFYSITLEKGEYSLIVSFIGYENYMEKISLDKDIKRNVAMAQKILITQEVTVTAEKADKNIKGQIGAIKMPVQTIKEIPQFLGEADVIKTIQLLPGISSACEGTSGFYVRGGSPDQNLILLDEAIVYNASHLFGFFSVFNADAVKDISLIKGGMPANYGGRISSVLDITMKEGNNREFEGNGSLGLISSHLTLQGPIKKDTSSFIITARRTYIDAIVKPFLPYFKKTKEYAGTGYHFYDINAKANYRFSDKDRVFISGYYGRDVFSFNSKTADFKVDIPWGNATASARWNHLFNEKLFMNATAVFSDYRFEFGAEQDEFEFILFSGIRDYNLKLDFYYHPTIRHNIKAGAIYIYHIFTPTSVTARIGETQLISSDIIEQLANDVAVYINDEFDVNEKLNISAGLRGTMFQQIGPFDRYIKNQFNMTIDTLHYKSWENVALYKHIEPRASIRYAMNRNTSLKASYAQNYQYVHLATISSASIPADIWVPSSDIVKPQFSTQYSLGYFQNFMKDMFETSVEVYYKDMKNQIEYKDGATPADNVGDNADNYFTFGKGTSYGVELFLKKQTGDITGWIGYTLSKTSRLFDEINYGIEYPAKYDRRHDLSMIVTYNYKENWTFSAVFIYATGNCTTLPIGRYLIDGRIVNEYGERNSFRMMPYHRLDLSVSYQNRERLANKKIKTSWNFSVYNVYNRANPYFIYFDNEGDILSGNMQTKAKLVSLFPILPSITLNIKFL